MNDNFSNYDLTQQSACEASNCEQAAKERLWALYLKGGDQHFKSQLHFQYSVANFYNLEDEAQCRHFADMFLRDVEKVFSQHHRDYAEAFFECLSPAFLNQPQHLVKLR